jgi:hypothetical protein
LKQEFTRAALLREVYPQIAQVRVDLEFHDAVSPAPSSQSFSYYPGARGFFRYACPCHSCSGEFDLSVYVDELVRRSGGAQRSRSVDVACQGRRIVESATREACAISVQVRVSATMHAKGKPA